MRASAGKLPWVAVLLASLLAFRFGAIGERGARQPNDVGFKTVVAPDRAAPIRLRTCTSRYDGKSARGDVRIVDISKRPVVSYAIEWIAFDRTGGARSKTAATYAVTKPMPPNAASAGRVRRAGANFIRSDDP